MTVAGPVMNLLSALLVAYMFTAQSFISGSFIAFSVYLGLGNLLPVSMPGHINDGQRLMMLVFDRKRSGRYFALLKLWGQVKHATPMQALDPGDLEQATAIQDESVETVQAHLFAYLAASKDTGPTQKVKFLETALKFSGNAASPLREMLALQAAFYQATQKQRLDLAEQWLKEAPEKRVLLEAREALEKEIAQGKNLISEPISSMKPAEESPLL